MSVALHLSDCPVLELRRYRLRTGGAAPLVEVFERRLVEAQEQAGMTVAGTFLDEQDADAFVWMRGFAGHEQRVAALTAFYGGPVWARNASAANATMIDSDDVLMLRATEPVHAPPPAVDRLDAGDPPRAHRLVVEVLDLPAGPAGDPAEAWFSGAGLAGIESAIGEVAAWRTDPRPNDFPRLPVRTDRVVVWLASFADDESRDDALRRLADHPIDRALDTRTQGRRRMLLSPTSRSAHPEPQRRRPAS